MLELCKGVILLHEGFCLDFFRSRAGQWREGRTSCCAGALVPLVVVVLLLWWLNRLLWVSEGICSAWQCRSATLMQDTELADLQVRSFSFCVSVHLNKVLSIAQTKAVKLLLGEFMYHHLL